MGNCILCSPEAEERSRKSSKKNESHQRLLISGNSPSTFAFVQPRNEDSMDHKIKYLNSPKEQVVICVI